MRAGIQRLMKATYGAVAPTVALALLALIGAGGIAFDYAHLAAMDTELQQAADQAALAAATQLDRSDGARVRAAAVIQDSGTNRLAANITRFANDGNDSGTSVDIASITFCKAFDDSVADTGTACTQLGAKDDDSDAAFVVVTTELRTAKYALTPVVAAFSGTISATAVAGVQSSVCNIAPIFVCTEDMNFPTDADIGKGMRMKVGSKNSWAPGNYGLLDFNTSGGGGNSAAIDALLGHGLNGCLVNSAVTTLPGNKNVTDAVNTRMDVYAGSVATKDPSICKADGTGCPAKNTGKDLVVTLTDAKNNTTITDLPAAPVCPLDPKAAGKSLGLSASPIKGFNRDNCHYTDTCAGGNFGNGTWDFAGYMAANHPGVSTGSVPHAGTTPTRYEVYKWELGDTTRLDPKSFVTRTQTLRPNGNYNNGVTTQCTYNRPVYGTTSYTAQKDRRLLPVVAANCDLLNGKGDIGSDFKLIRVFDVFLTEPSMQRTTYPGPTDDKEIYGEVVGPAKTFAGTSGFQYYARTKPYLVR